MPDLEIEMEGKKDPLDARLEPPPVGDVDWTPQRRRPAKRDRGLEPAVQQHIGRRLRAVYDDVLRQPVPDRFAELLSKLDGDKDPRS